MNCCQCQGIEEFFNRQVAERQLADYRKRGPDRTTRLLIEALKGQGVRGATLLDIGGGIGAIQHALLQAGTASAQDVDASQAYLRAAQEEAERGGYAERIQFRHGNFVELASQVKPADIVTLDRVICCYPDMDKMVRLSSAKARRLYGLVYPRDGRGAKLGIRIINALMRLRGTPFRIFIHPSQEVESLIHQEGFQRIAYAQTAIWQMAVYLRPENQYNNEYALPHAAIG